MLEKTIEKKVCDYAKATGWLVFKFSSPSQRGVPDRMLIRNGEVCFIEFKAKGKKPTKLQQNIHAKITGQGIPVYIIDNVEFGEGIIDGYGSL